MRRRLPAKAALLRRPNLVPTALLAGLAALAVACGEDGPRRPVIGGDPDKPLYQQWVGLSIESCVPRDMIVPQGRTRFFVTNLGDSRVNELYVLYPDRTFIAEVEAVIVGLDASMIIDLPPGQYLIHCPFSEEEDGTLTVTE